MSLQKIPFLLTTAAILAVAGAAVTLSVRAQSGTTMMQCTDSDGGQVFETPGTVRDVPDEAYIGPRTFSDVCIVYVNATGYQTRSSCTPQEDRCSVREGYCQPNDWRFMVQEYRCPNGCRDGACLVTPPSSSLASSSSVAVSSSAQSSIAGDARCSITLRPSSAGNTMYMSPAEHIAFTVSCPSLATTATTSIVKPDGSIMALPSASNFYAWTWGVRSADVPAGVNLIRVCINDVTCQGWSIHLVVFTIIGSSTPQSSSSSNGSATATGATVGSQTTSSTYPTTPTSSVAAPVSPSVTPSFPTAPPARSGATLPPQMPTPPNHPAPSPTWPRAQTGSITVEKKVSKAKLQALKKQQQAFRRELRSLERSLLRKKNVAALSQIADLRDELADLDLRDPSAADNLRSLQGEIADLRNAVSKKKK